MAEVDFAGNVTKSYGYKSGSTWTTDPLFMKVGGQYYFYQNDHLGTPQKLTAVNGAVVWAAKYSSFGEADVDASSSITNNLRFAGQYLDQETGLHYNWHRYYDVEAARYLKSDPIGLRGGINYYSYALNNPVNLNDPQGLKTPCNTVNETYCRADCSNKGRSYKSCFQTSAGDKWLVECNCGPKWITDKKEPDQPIKPKPPVFNLQLCLSICEGKFECETFARIGCKTACYLTAFAEGLSGGDSGPAQ